MLSRIAESLFWMGRYMERADDTARILDVELHRFLEDPGRDQVQVVRGLLGALGLADISAARTSIYGVAGRLCFDSSLPGSIISSVTIARENARGIRESISSELWECVNVTYHSVSSIRQRSDSMGPREYFGFARMVRERAALASGIAETTMPRDEGWSFFTLGRSIERVDMTVRLIGLADLTSGSLRDWTATLRSCSALEAYLRTYGGAIDGIRVLEFLVLDRLFPRSIRFSLSAASAALTEISPAAGRSGTSGEAQRAIGRARAAIELRDIGEIEDHLPEILILIESTCSAASAAVARRYFRETSPEPWSGEEMRGYVQS